MAKRPQPQDLLLVNEMHLIDNYHIEKGNKQNFKFYLKTADTNYSSLQTLQ